MNWKTKSKEIAAIVMQDSGGALDYDSVLDMLEKAAYAGMVFECDNWVMKRT